MTSNIYGYLKLLTILISALFTMPDKGFGQERLSQREEILELANSAYGADDRLINGKYYQPKHFYAEGHPYFLTKEWSDASLYIKGIVFNHINTKYNIEDDAIIIQYIFKSRISKNILLNNSFVDSLIIGRHVFHNTTNFQTENSIGIAELVYDGTIKVYYKHTVEFYDKLSENLLNGRYLEPKRKLYLFKKNTFYPITSKKDFLSHFPERTKEIKLFLRRNKIRFKKIHKGELYKLIHFSEQL